MLLDFLIVKEETEVYFKRIADSLFNEYAIETHDSLFRFLDIEFYWNSKTHIDKSTYSRNHVDPRTGDWFFHYSGVDIALKNEDTGGHGGILIRGILEVNLNKQYKGPMVCAMRLFSGTNAFNETIRTKIIKKEFDKKYSQKTTRINLGQNAISNGTDKLAYRFFIDPNK